MGIRVDVLSLSSNVPGHARVRVSGWSETTDNLEFSVQSSQSQHFLQKEAQWSSSPYWFQITQLETVDDAQAFETRIGPELLDPLLELSNNAMFRIELKGSGLSEETVLRLAKDLQHSLSQGSTPTNANSGTLEVPATAPVEEQAPSQATTVAQAAPLTEPEVVTPAPALAATTPTKKNRWLLPVLLLVLLAAIAAGAWWWLKQQPEPAAPKTAEPEKPAQVEPAVTAQPCTLESMKSQSELAFVQSCIQQAPDSTALLEVINVAKANSTCGVAQRLYANRAQGGDVQIATAYAHEYDPKYHQASECFKAPDNATAAYWYETILSFDENNADAKARLEELKQ